MSRAGLRRTTTFRIDNGGWADNVPLRLRGAFGRPPVGARNEKAPAFARALHMRLCLLRRCVYLRAAM